MCRHKYVEMYRNKYMKNRIKNNFKHNKHLFFK